MGFQFTPYIVVMLSAAVVCFIIGCYAWRHRETPVDTLIIFIMMMAITAWLVASALGYATTDPASKIVWAKIEYIGVVSVPLLVFIFAVNYSGLKHRLSTRNLVLIALVPAITLLLTWTNEMHGLIWSKYVPYQENGVMFSNKTYGPWFWVYWIYSYLLLLAASILIIRTALASSKAFMGQAVALISGILVPWVCNAIYVFRISPLGSLDLTPLAFAFSGIMLSLGIARWRLFDVKPTAHVAVIENLVDGLILLNSYNRIIDINPAARQFFGVSALETIGKQGSRILPPELFSNVQRDPGGKIRLEMKLTDKGREGHFELTGTPFYDKLGDLIGRIIIVHDTTALKTTQERLIFAERKLADEALRESEVRYRSIVENVNDGIYIHDFKGNIIDLNENVCRMLGYTRNELVGSNLSKVDSQENTKHLPGRMAQLMKDDHILFEGEHIRKDGGVVPVEVSGKVVSREGDGIIQGFVRDITERKQVEAALRKSEEKYRLLIENSNDIIYTLNLQGVCTFVSPGWKRLLGHDNDAIIGHPFQEFVHTDDIPRCEIFMANIIETRVPLAGIEYRVRNAAGEWIGHNTNAAPIFNSEGAVAYLVCSANDITDRKRLEEEHQRMEKLESIGTLAGGIAHNFNNILTSILGNISLASMEAQDGSELKNSLEQAEKASLRAKDLTLQLLTFSKGGAPVKEIASLTELLKDITSSALTGSNVKCNFSIPDGLWQAEIDARQVSQVIYNLVINARQAMPAGGTIELSAENIALNKTQSPGKGLPIKAGDYIRVAITDHGTGIPKEHLEKIFNPFFTTKINAIGLGVATAFSIARRHGGHLSVESKVGSGSTFYLYLPASAPKLAKKEAIKAAGKARILVMDDEEGVRNVAGRMLKHIGYQDVELAKHGAEAIKLYKAAMESGNPFSVAILDLTIPGGMGGEIAIQKLLKIDPGVKAIISSGYVDDPVMSGYREYGFSGMVVKPYTLEQLGKALQDVIG